jgi:hypothetical protein
MRSLVPALSLSLAAALSACGGDDDGATKLDVADNCNPLGFDHCMAPWPSSAFEVDDATTPTGRKLAIPANTLLRNSNGSYADPGPWNRADGYSAVGPIVMHFPGGIDGAPLPDPTEFDLSISEASPTVLIDMVTGERVAHFAELDVPAAELPGRQAVMIRPAARLVGGRRYAVGITNRLKAPGGGELPVPAGFAALRDGTETSHPLLEKMRPGFADVLAALADAGTPTADLVVAWDFTVASDEFVRRLATRARDETLAELDRMPSTVEITGDEQVGDGLQIRRRIDGTMTAPLFLTQNGDYQPNTKLALGADGLPALQGRYSIPFTAIIPACAYGAARQPVGIMMYGHGLNGTGEQAASGAIRETAAAACVISVGTDMRGMSAPDIGNIARALTDLNHADEVMENLVQGLANHVALARAMETVLPNTVFVCRPADTSTGCVAGRTLADPDKLYYYGLSQGHIFGTAVMAYVPNIKRAVLGVGGGGYSTMLDRSTNWPTYRTIMAGAYEDPLDIVMAINLFQQRWDFTETSGIANVVLAGTATGTPPKQILLHMAVGDDQVPNLATEWQARSMDIPVILPASTRVPWGMATQEAPVVMGSGLVVMDGDAPMIPLTNVPAPETGMHNLTRNQPASRRQIAHFFATGEIKNECAGACFCAQQKCE